MSFCILSKSKNVGNFKIMKLQVVTLLMSITILATSQQTDCPTQLNLFAGAGLPETFHVGLRLNHKDWHYDASAGTTLGGLLTLNGNAAYHFGSSQNSNLCNYKPWFTSLGLSYMQWKSVSANGQDSYLNARIGRDLRANEIISFSLSLGLGVSVYHYYHSSGWGLDLWTPVIPSGQFSIQLKLFELNKKNS